MGYQERLLKERQGKPDLDKAGAGLPLKYVSTRAPVLPLHPTIRHQARKSWAGPG